jgi:RNA polymerase sigma factor (TIGR02999 family)
MSEAGQTGADEITRLLGAWRTGDPRAKDQLLPLVYDDLRRVARGHFRGRPDAQTLSPTGLVHEAFLKLVEHHHGAWKDRGHFFALASRAMRQILVDHARARGAVKRGGVHGLQTLGEDLPQAALALDDMLSIDEALEKLEAIEPRWARLVEMRVFAGLSVEESAEALDVSERTVKRDWVQARAFLALTLGGA